MKNCKYCNRGFKSIHALKTHEFRCKQNPNYEQNNARYAITNKKFLERVKNKPSPYFDYISKCQKCGKEFTQRTTQSLINHNKHQKCCCSKCAHSRIRTEETKNKIRESVKESLCKKGKSKNQEYNTCVKNPKYYRSKEIKNLNCRFCGKAIRAKYTKYAYCYECAENHNLPNLQLWDENNKTIPSRKKIESSRNTQLKLLKEGKHKGWNSRNVTSYPEQFWKKVLELNRIHYSFNHPISKKSLGIKNDASNYFLDFLIDENIDLEIDGKQHKYSDRAESDIHRDNILIKNGYIVYRIEWNEIKTKDGKIKMKNKIDNFINFYKNRTNIK